MSRVPESLREDALQEGWLAHCLGAKPDSAVRRLIRRHIRHRATSFEESRHGQVVEACAT